MRLRLIVGLGLGLGACSNSEPHEVQNEPIPDAGGTADEAVTIDRYDYAFDLESGEARAQLTFRGNLAEGGCVALESQLLLREASVERLPQGSVEQRAAHVSVCGDFRAAAAASLSARVTVPVIADASTGVGFSRKLDAFGNQFSYLLGWVDRCSLFGPCDPAPHGLSHFVFEVAHRSEDTVLCPGARRAGNGETRCELLETRAPTYSSFAIASNPAWVAKPLVTSANVRVVTYEVPGGRVHAALDAPAVATFLLWISAELGPFPYGSELRVAMAPTEWLGMEHPANIVLREDLPDVPSLYANMPLHVLLHELAHQWAGNRTTLAHHLDFVWKEAIVEYLVYVFEDEQRPALEAATTRALWHSLGVGAPYPVRPRATPEVPLSAWTAGGYGSGPMTLFLQLEAWLGRPALLAAVRNFLRGSEARSMLDLQAALEAASGRDLEPYFKAWVFEDHTSDWPVFQVTTAQLGASRRVTVTQEHSAPTPFPCLLEVELVGPTQRARVQLDFGLERPSNTASSELPFTEEVLQVIVDPDHRVLDFTPSTKKFSAPLELRFHPN